MSRTQKYILIGVVLLSLSLVGVSIAVGRISMAANTMDNTISITKDAPQVVNNGDVFTYTMTIANNSTISATGVAMADPIPAGITPITPTISCSLGSCNFNKGTVTWSAALPATQSGSITFQASADQGKCGLVENKATAEATTFNQAASATADTFVSCSSTPAIKATKDATPAVYKGGVIKYTINIYNVVDSATTAVMTDTAPAGTTPIVGSITCSSGACSYNAEKNWFEWSGDVNGMSSVQITFQAQTGDTDQACGPVTNDATVTSPLNSAPIQASASTLVSCNKVIATKNATPDVILGLQNINYSIVLQNLVITDTTGVLVDKIPAGTTFTGTITASSGVANYNAVSNSVQWSGSITATSSVAISFKVVPSTCGVVTNSAVFDTDLNNTALTPSATTNVHCFQVTKDAPGDVPIGGTIPYSIHINNTITDTTAIMTDTLPVGTVLTGTVSATSGNASFDQATNSVLWNGDSLQNTSVTISFAVMAPTICGQSVVNIAQVKTAALTAVIPAAATTNVLCVQATKKAETSVFLNGTIHYGILVSNLTMTDTTASINDPLPIGTVPIADSIHCSSGSLCQYDAQKNQFQMSPIISTTNNLMASSSISITFEVQAPRCQRVTNVAGLRSILNPPVLITREAVTQVDCVQPVKTATPSIRKIVGTQSGVIDYSIAINNLVVTSTAATVNLFDIIPQGTTYVSNSLDCTSGECNFNNQITPTVGWSGDIVGSTSVTITFQASVDLAVCHTILNVANVNTGWNPSTVQAFAKTNVMCLSPIYLPFIHK